MQALQTATRTIAAAKDQSDLRSASEQVATAMEAVGLGVWGRFLADAQERAGDPATLAAVAASQPRPPPAPTPQAATAPPPAVQLVADGGPSASPAFAAEPEHGPIWSWLHGLGLTETRHEQATNLRRVMGSQGGLVYMRDGVPLDVDHMSDDDVLALDRETRGQPHGPPLVGAAAPIMTSWGWNHQDPYKKAVNQLRLEGTHETLNGRIPTREEAERMIEESGGKVDRSEPGHHPDGDSPHHEYHVNYTTAGTRPFGGKKATVIVQPWK